MEKRNDTANTTFASLRISYLGGGYDYPEFFATQPALILSEGTDMKISCTSDRNVSSASLRWRFPEQLSSGLGSSAATVLSMIRAKYPHASHQDQVDATIHLERLQAGGWQDAIASGHQGIFLIRLFQNTWEVEHFDKKCLVHLKKYRKLYQIPDENLRKPTSILKEMRHREICLKRMQALVEQGAIALKRLDFADFGRYVRAGWDLKKTWHPGIETPVIEKMTLHAWKVAGAWGWKVCGAGGQGYLLVIGNKKCHEIMKTLYRRFEVDNNG